VAVYGDTRGNREGHRAVVAAIAAVKPDLVVFTGDAIECRPAGHLPDLGIWSYLVPFWPQYIRGHPLFSLNTLVPFPAVIHEVLVSPFLPVRDPDGFNGFLEDTAPLRRDARIPFLFVPGNHDLYHRFDREAVARLFGSPIGSGGKDPHGLWYSLDTGGVRFLMLDTGTDVLGDTDPLPPNGPQLAWLETALADAERRGLVTIVCFHIPAFSSGREDPPMPSVRRRIVEGVLDRHRVGLVISGHAHAYERIVRPGKDGSSLTYVVSGGGGAPFHHAVGGERQPGSRVFIEETLHFVLLEIGQGAIQGRMVPVKAPTAGGQPGEKPIDAFEVLVPPADRAGATRGGRSRGRSSATGARSS
jgi:3',5'-cyclic AMP phosphodiesterase CpdA